LFTQELAEFFHPEHGTRSAHCRPYRAYAIALGSPNDTVTLSNVLAAAMSPGAGCARTASPAAPGAKLLAGAAIESDQAIKPFFSGSDAASPDRWFNVTDQGFRTGGSQ
jgi:hypothetical protein